MAKKSIFITKEDDSLAKESPLFAKKSFFMAKKSFFITKENDSLAKESPLFTKKSRFMAKKNAFMYKKEKIESNLKTSNIMNT